MIEYRKGNILESECEAIVNTVNCVGAMGKGIALQFKRRYPEMFKVYKEACDRGEVMIGKMYLWESSEQLITGKKHLWESPERLIINFPTKDDWRNKSEKVYIYDGLYDLYKVITERGIKSIAIPALGCSNGGLSWDFVKPLLEIFCNRLPEDVKVVIYEPL